MWRGVEKEVWGTHDEGEVPLDSRLFYPATMKGLAAFALYSRTNGSLGVLVDPRELGEVYETAFKLLFAVAVTAEFMDMEASVEGTMTRRLVMTGLW